MKTSVSRGHVDNRDADLGLPYSEGDGQDLLLEA